MTRLIAVVLFFLSFYNTAFSEVERSENVPHFASRNITQMAPSPSNPPSEQCQADIVKLKAIVDKQKEVIKALEEELKKCKEKRDGKNR